MKTNFLRRFIEQEKFVQNPPLETARFIEFCQKRGIHTSERELEFLEKERLLIPLVRIERPIGEEEMMEVVTGDGATRARPAESGLRDDEREVRRYVRRFYFSYAFDDRFTSLLLNWLENGNLFDPAERPFQAWSSFIGEELASQRQKVISFYSSFQIYWLEKVKSHSAFSISLHEDPITAVQQQMVFLQRRRRDLASQYDAFRVRLEFLLSIQTFCFPYGKTGSKFMQLIGTPEQTQKWHEARRTFDPKAEVDLLGIEIEAVASWYKLSSAKAMQLLGITNKTDDWIQLWKSIRWDKKDALEGSIRLGIEYLQWALMLKRFLQSYLGRKILDVDEISNVSPDDIVTREPSASERELRASRDWLYFDPRENKNYYYDKYRRLFYLSNRFELDYQLRVMVFVEGETEEQVLPRFFEEEFGATPEEYGIRILTFEGVDKLLSTSKAAEKLRMLITELEREERQQILTRSEKARLNDVIEDFKRTDIVITNWTSLISYNLEQWQIIPFFIADNEGNAKLFLDSGGPIRFENATYNLPKEWKYIWGIDNQNAPFEGKDFEFANFSDLEIAQAVAEILGETVDAQYVKDVRASGAGINSINPKVKRNKIRIVERLSENLITAYKKRGDASILERPVFKAIDRIMNLVLMNRLPVYRVSELETKDYIRTWLERGELGS
jgi:hypothetical protein